MIIVVGTCNQLFGIGVSYFRSIEILRRFEHTEAVLFRVLALDLSHTEAWLGALIALGKSW